MSRKLPTFTKRELADLILDQRANSCWDIGQVEGTIKQVFGRTRRITALKTANILSTWQNGPFMGDVDRDSSWSAGIRAIIVMLPKGFMGFDCGMDLESHGPDHLWGGTEWYAYSCSSEEDEASMRREARCFAKALRAWKRGDDPKPVGS
jgi:hypothetical protein